MTGNRRRSAQPVSVPTANAENARGASRPNSPESIPVRDRDRDRYRTRTYDQRAAPAKTYVRTWTLHAPATQSNPFLVQRLFLYRRPVSWRNAPQIAVSARKILCLCKSSVDTQSKLDSVPTGSGFRIETRQRQPTCTGLTRATTLPDRESKHRDVG